MPIRRFGPVVSGPVISEPTIFKPIKPINMDPVRGTGTARGTQKPMISELDTPAWEALDKKGPMLVEFYSKTCGPCKMLGFVLKDVDKAMPDLPIYQIDFNANEDLKNRCGVKGFPTLLFLRDGEEVSRLEGLKQKPVILKEIEKIM